MLSENGGQLLRDFTDRSFQERLTEIVPGVWFAAGFGHSNAVFVEAAHSVILIDTLDTLERGQRLLSLIRERTGKEVRTIVYSHSHPDHTGGAGAFAESAPEIIAFAPHTPTLAGTELLRDVQSLRGGRQFGYALSDEENISQGIGRREGVVRGEGRAFVPASTVYREDRVVREIDGVRLELVRLPGEAEDGAMVWLPEQEVLCCGDTFYGCFPNLYAIRGGQYRDLAGWVESLDTLLSYPARHLLPGHTGAVSGPGAVREVLTNFRNAVDCLLTRTLEGMNAGKTADELAAEIRLPPEYARLPYLGEFYGCAEWTVREIYAAYLGWFDGDPARLHPLPPARRAAKTVALMGGARRVLDAARAALGEGELQWCLELCGLLSDLGEEPEDVRPLKAAALRALAELETSANGRHYYLSCARELEG